MKTILSIIIFVFIHSGAFAAVVCIDSSKAITLLPELLSEIASDECGGTTVPIPPVIITPTAEKPVKYLTDYKWEDSNEVVPGKAILLPPKSLTGSILRTSVNDEEMKFHSVWRSGVEIWYATHNIAHYGKASLEVETTETIYRTKSDDPPPASAREELIYWGRHNGDRPTWYGNPITKRMDKYPSVLRVIVPGCLDTTITHDGRRKVEGGLIVKQSDVPGRGLAVIYSSSCKSKKAYLDY